MKQLILRVADLFAVIWRFLPARLRATLIKGLIVLDTRGDPAKGLARAFIIEDGLLHVLNERALALGQGVHPKHRLTHYHDFFIQRIKDGDRVLDVGCSYGAVARSIAKAHPMAQIMGVELDQAKLDRALNFPQNPSNLKFFHGDATKDLPEGGWNVVVLSNVLEHIAERVGFLKALCKHTQCQRLLIRVPYFERDWTIPMRRELNVNYFSDSDHKIEHTREEFKDEMQQAGLVIDEIQYRWGEIWATVLPK